MKEAGHAKLVLGIRDILDSPEALAPEWLARYGDLVQRISFDTSAQLDPERARRVIAGIRA